jgi:hypothetical protein
MPLAQVVDGGVDRRSMQAWGEKLVPVNDGLRVVALICVAASHNQSHGGLFISVFYECPIGSDSLGGAGRIHSATGIAMWPSRCAMLTGSRQTAAP